MFRPHISKALIVALAIGLATPVMAQTEKRASSADRAPPQQTQNGAPTADAAAAQGVAILQALAAKEAVRDLGLSRDEASRATLGAPLPIYFVGLDQLRAYKAGGDTKAMFKAAGAKFYPVIIGGQVRSAVRVAGEGANWSVASVGNAPLATAVAGVRQAMPMKDGPPVALVEVLVLNLAFLGEETQTGWRLTPVADDASVKLKAGVSEAAGDVFARLAPIAQRYNGDPT